MKFGAKKELILKALKQFRNDCGFKTILLLKKLKAYSWRGNYVLENDIIEDDKEDNKKNFI